MNGIVKEFSEGVLGGLHEEVIRRTSDGLFTEYFKIIPQRKHRISGRIMKKKILRKISVLFGGFLGQITE